MRLTNLLSFYSRVYEAIDTGENYVIMYLDFSKAFERYPIRVKKNKVKTYLRDIWKH